MTDGLEDRPKKIKSPEGCHDILPEDQVYFSLIRKVLRRRCRQHGILRMSPCMFEHQQLFERVIGAETDVVSKELYSFESKSGKNKYALRPEFTAGIARAYIEHGMASLPQPVRLYDFGAVFRHDRPQKNRYRQFFQFSTEIIGERDPGVDAQMIHLAYQMMKDLQIEKNLVVKINTLGTSKERAKYTEALKDYFLGKERYLSFESQERIQTNPLRILDSKDEDDKVIAAMAPKFSLFHSEETKAFFAEVCALLDEVHVPYVVDESLVRGLDYYCDTAFEIMDVSEGGQQTTLIGGGRYDGLIEQIGGNPTPAFGFAMGIERVVNRMKECRYQIPVKDKVHVYVAQLGSEAKKKAFVLLDALHNAGVNAMGAIGTPSIKAQLRNADKFQADYALILGQIEVQEKTIILRNMKAGTQEIVPMNGVVEKVCMLVGEKNLQKVDFYELDEMGKGVENLPRIVNDEIEIF